MKLEETVKESRRGEVEGVADQGTSSDTCSTPSSAIVNQVNPSPGRATAQAVTADNEGSEK